MKRRLTADNGFTKQMYKLLIPLVIQNLLSAAVSSSDVIMLNYVGQSYISAVSLAANYASVISMVFYGLGTGATLLCAQYYGKRDFQAIRVVEGIALRYSVIITLAVSLLAFTAPMLVGALFQQLYSIVDSVIIGRFVNLDALAAVSASYPVTTLFVGMATGGSTGASILVSYHFGSRQTDRMMTAVRT